jgi:pimeloyl-ACP methyl ester carboxylesterase
LLAEEYDWSEDVAELKAPTLIIIGDADMMPAAHAVALFELLGGRDGPIRECPTRGAASHHPFQYPEAR